MGTWGEGNRCRMTQPITDRLVPQVADYQAEGYSLASDLTHLNSVRGIGATEATIFYSARILEVLSSAAVQAAGITPSASAFANLETLTQFNFVPTTTLYWANGLRRLGNDVRHILRHHTPADADLAALFAERWIEWFFCQFRLGAKLPGITIDCAPLLAAGDARLAMFLKSVDAAEFDPVAQLAGGDLQPPFMIAATLAAVIADLLLCRGETDLAFSVLDPALAKFPDDLRIQQLAVLAWKRRGDLKKAIEIAAPLLARTRDDDETAGIIAGVYKQQFLNAGESEMLQKSHRAYLGGWEGSKSSNAYLGINAAATALWAGRAADSRRLAGEVRQLLLRRVDAVAKAGDKQMLAASYWDEVTLAEAELLTGEISAAKSRYQAAFAGQAKSKGMIKVATDQAARHLAPLGLSIPGKDFFNSSVAETDEKPFIIGVTGHRKLEDEPAIRSKVIEAMNQLAAGKNSLIVLSAVAAGADSLVAEAGLDDKRARLRAVLPLEVDDYRRDFDPVEAARFQNLLNRADAISFPPGPEKPARGKAPAGAAAAALEDRTAAYERAGFFIVDRCDALIAIWDGQPARGRGGTAEIIAYARKAGKKIAWIKSQSPYELTFENFKPV
jgi:hypothetical protein